MVETFKIFKENYQHLPKRFVNKIDSDIDFILHANIPYLKKIYLFGSCARGVVRNTSDVDLLIVTEKTFTNRTLAAQIRWTLDDDICGIKTDVVYMTEDSMLQDSAFHRIINSEKVIIMEVFS